jgi:hypothetical protein
MKRVLLRASLLAAAVLPVSCNTVEFYEKGAFADPAMEFAESAAQMHWQQKVQYSDEGAAGGLGTDAGGGCGCY